MSILKVTYQRGMLKNVNHKKGIQEISFEGSQLSPDILQAIEENNILRHGGTYGNPAAGRPIEYDHIRVEHSKGVTDITFHNRGMSLLFGDNEIERQIHRVCCILQDHLPR